MHMVKKIIKTALVAATGASLTLSGCGKSRAEKEYEEEMLKSKAEFERTEARVKQEAEEQERIRRQNELLELERLLQAQRDKEEQECLAEKENQENERRREQERQEELAKLRAYAEEKFSRISLSPAIRLSKRAEYYGVQAILQGKNLDQYQQLLASSDFPALYKLIEQQEDYTSSTSIDNAVSELLHKEFYIRLNPNRGQIPENHLTIIGLPAEDSHKEYFSIRQRTALASEKSPDGSGFLARWDATSRELLVLVSNVPDIFKEGHVLHQVEKIERAAYAERRILEKRLELGELSDDQFNQQVQQLAGKLRQDYLKLLDLF